MRADRRKWATPRPAPRGFPSGGSWCGKATTTDQEGPMDAQRFDALTRLLATTRTRRRALRLLLGGALAVAQTRHRAAAQDVACPPEHACSMNPPACPTGQRRCCCLPGCCCEACTGDKVPGGTGNCFC